MKPVKVVRTYTLRMDLAQRMEKIEHKSELINLLLDRHFFAVDKHKAEDSKKELEK